MTGSCPHCGETGLPARSRFCLACGSGLGPSAREAVPSYTPSHLSREVLTSRTALEGERKEVTVLLADVAGSLAMAEALDPEEVHAVMDGFFALALDAVHAESGTINQFRGDGFMALFGAPRAHGDDTARALRAALALRGQASGYSQSVRARFGFPLALRIGIHTGRVWVGSIGSDRRRDYTAEGSTVGVAARLERLAAPGQILVSGETADRVGSRFELAELGRRSLQGVQEPVRVCELVGRGPYETRLDVELAGGRSSFVGRENELDRLSRGGALAARGMLAVVEIRGQEGAGKSRLAREYVRRVEESSGVVEGRCRPGDATRAYALLLDLLRGWPESVPGADSAAHLVEQLESGGAADLEPPSPEAISLALGKLLDEACEPLPLTVLLEDTQWIDPSTKLCLEEALLATPTRRILALLTSRPEPEVDWDARLPLERFTLGGLERGAETALARAILRDCRDCDFLVSLAVERGRGNPLFIEEMARALREQETESTGREWPPNRDSPLPHTLTEVIAARVDSLRDPMKRLLQSASVVGLPFDVSLLREIDPEAGPETPELLDGLVERGFLCRDAQGALDFNHVLVRDVAYDQILNARKGGIHLRLADALARQPLANTPDGAARIGESYDRAGDASRAVTYLTRAGTAYLRMHATTESVLQLRRAWELQLNALPQDPAARNSVALPLASALNTLDRSNEAAAVLDMVEAESLDISDRIRLAEACIESGWVGFSERNEVERGRHLLCRGLELIADEPEGRGLEMRAHGYLARFYHETAEVERAVRSARRIQELATALGDRVSLAFGRAKEGENLASIGWLDPALAACREALHVAEACEHDSLMGLVLTSLAKVQLYRGDADAALRTAARAWTIGERSGQKGTLHLAATWSGYAYLLLDRPREAAAEFSRLEEISATWLPSLQHQSRGELELGRYHEAKETAWRCLDADPPRLIRARVLRTYGLAVGLSEAGSRDAAERAITESISLCDTHGLRPYLAEAHEALAELCLHRGDAERAQYYVDRAVEGYEACGMHVHARRALGVQSG